MAKAKQLPSGSWRCMAYLGKDKKGKIIRKSITAPTKSEAEALCKELEVKERASDVLLDKNMTVEEL